MADAELTVRISGDTGDLESAISRVESQLSRLERSGGSNVGAGMERNFKTAADRLEQTAKQWKNLGEGVDTLTKPFQVAGVAMAAGAVASSKFAIDFENNFADVRKTVDGTDEQLNKIKQDIIDMTTVGINGHSAIPQTTAELTELAAAGGQLGIQTENISSFTETMAMMGSATNLAGEEGAKTLARFMNVANVSQGEVQNLGSSIVDLGNHFATTEAEIAAMAQRMGATGTAVGISAQDVLAYSTALSSLGVEAEAGGSSISRIWMDIQTQVSTGGELLGEFAKVSGKTTKEFAEGWKNDASGTFKDFVDGLSKSKDLVGTLKNLGFDNIRDLQALQKLAGPQGIQLLTDALQRSNNAWSENTALVNEFENKAGTTASQIQVMKNNLVEAGRSLGETFLPTINNGVTDIKNFAQGISKMSDGQKQALITTGKWVIGLGAAGKITSGVTKRIGETTEAVAKIKKAFELGGTFASVTPVLTAAAIGITAVATAVTVGKSAYDAWYRSQFKWAEGLSDADNKVQDSLDKYKQISNLQRTLKEARLTIENPESSQEQVDNAKAKIEEIKALLEEEYNLTIKSDNSDLDNAVEQVKKLTGNDLKQAIADEQMQLANLAENYRDAMTRLPEMQAQYDNANERLTYLKLLNSEYATLATESQDGILTQEQMNRAMNDVARSMGITAEQAKELYDGVTPLETALQGAQKEVDDLKPKIDDLANSQRDYVNISKSFANKLTEYFSEQLVSGDMDGAAKTLERIGKAAADAGLDLEGYGKILTDIAKAAGMIEENQTIKISADGDISVLEEVEDKANELNGKNVELTVNADGTEAYATIDGVQYMVAAYDGKTGEAILTADGTKADMVINLSTGEVHAFSNEEGIATLSAIENVTATAQQAAKSIAGVKSKTVTITAVYTTINKRIDQFSSLNGWATKQAKGTQDFKGGMAMINDQRGVSDPRELVEVNGKGYIFEGRDVVLPLPRHAKVYTAGQTKEMLAMAGLRRYARGKDNQEWENAQDDWAHYTKVNNVSAFEALEHWDEMMKKFSYDAEAVKDIQEEIVASTKDMWDEEMATMQFYLDMGVDSEEHYYKWLETYRDEHFDGNDEMWRKATLDITKYNKQMAKESAEALNDASEEYIRFHTIAGDWDEIDDSPLAAYARVLDRAEEDLANGVYESVEEKNEFLKNFGSNMFDAYKEDADNWIQHERDYNAMSTEDYISALNRKKQRTNEYFAQGIIDYQTYLKEVQDYNEKIMSAYADEVNQWRDDADFYQRQSEVYGWGFNGTGHKSALKYWQARLDREIENSHDMNLSANERQSALRYADEARMEIYKARQDELDDELEKFRQSIEDTRTALDDEVQNMRDAWTTEDRKADMSELAEQIAVFKYAQTKEGIDKYKSLNEEYTRLSREQKIEDIQAANSEKLDRMQAQYDKMEQDKIDELAGLKDELLKYGGIAVISDQTRQIAAAANDNISALVSNMSDFGESFSSFAARLFEKLDERPTVINNYDNSTQNIANNIRGRADLQAAALGVGLGSLSMMLFGRRR